MVDLGGLSNDIASGAVGGGAMAIIVGEVIRRTWRRLSRDRTEVAKDRGEESILERALRRADEAERRADELSQRVDLAFRERNEALSRESQAVSRVGALEAEIRHLTDTVEFLRRQVDELASEVRDERRQRKED